MDTTPPLAANAPRGFHLLAKPTGAICNLDCTYCFFLTKEALYPNSNFRMSDELLELYIRQLLEAHRTPEVNVAWQGGEPMLMGLEFFERSVALVEKHRRCDQKPLYTMQTNGTKIDDAWAAFFKRHDFIIGLSADGPREMHDVYRVNKGGGGTFEQVARGWECLMRHAVDVNILCTVHAANGHHPLEVYRFFRDEWQARHLQFIPIVERATAETLAAAAGGWGAPSERIRAPYTQHGTLVTARSIQAEQYGRFLCGIFDEWVRKDVGRVYVQSFDVALGNWMGRHSLCVHAPTCGDALALEHNGDLYSCDHFVEPGFLLGNIRNEAMADLVASPRQRRFGQDKSDALPRYCRECDVRFACHGGCPKDRFIESPDGEPGLNYLCAGYQMFFQHITGAMDFMAGELRRERAPANVMGLLAGKDARLRQAFAGAGRNDACPCGSGAKFKVCHGRTGV